MSSEHGFRFIFSLDFLYKTQSEYQVLEAPNDCFKLKFVHKKKRLTDIVFENVLKTFSKEFQIILSTTKRDIDNRLIRHTKKNYKNIKTFRGNYSNVEKRFLKTIISASSTSLHVR